MSRFGTLVRGIRLGRGFDLPTMAAALDASPDHLSQVESGATLPPAAQRRRWAAALGFTDLLDLDRHWRDGWPRLAPLARPHPLGWIPVINAAPAGPPLDYEEFGLDSSVGYDYVPRATTPEQQHAPTLFAVILVGDSMTPTWHDGDLAILRPLSPEDPLPIGSPVLARFTAARDHTCTFKRIFRAVGDQLELRADNPDYASILVTPDEIDRLAVAIECRAAFARPISARPSRLRVDPVAEEFPDD